MSKSKSPKKAKDTQTMTKVMTNIDEAPDLGPSILMDDELGLEVGREVALGNLKKSVNKKKKSASLNRAPKAVFRKSQDPKSNKKEKGIRKDRINKLQNSEKGWKNKNIEITDLKPSRVRLPRSKTAKKKPAKRSPRRSPRKLSIESIEDLRIMPTFHCQKCVDSSEKLKRESPGR